MEELDYYPDEFSLDCMSIEDLHLIDEHTTSFTKEEFYEEPILTTLNN